MVEFNPLEGLHTNVLGTRNVADACRRAAVAAMVLVSTDKAVNPPNVMGASKRLAESYCQALDLLRQTSGSGTRYITVRFGNVRSEEHTSELQSLMRISYAVFCLKTQNIHNPTKQQPN